MIAVSRSLRGLCASWCKSTSRGIMSVAAAGKPVGGGKDSFRGAGPGLSVSPLGATANVVKEYASSATYDWRRVKGFLFDIDGTLVDTDHLHLVAFRDMLAKDPQFTHEVDEAFFMKHISGRSNPDIVRDLLPHLSAEDKEQWIVDKEAYFCDLARTEIEPMVGLADLLRWIKANNVKCAAVTNAPRKNAEMLLGGIGMRDEFDLLIIANECSHNKPHPEPYLKAMRELNLRSEDCVAFEDSVPGATAAVAAGAHTVGVLTTQTAQAMENVGVAQCISDYVELLDEIKKATA